MMDAYLPMVESIAPVASEIAAGGWYGVPSSQTVLLIKVDARQTYGSQLSTNSNHRATYAVLELPAHAGLQRLRSFANFPDNWNGEGAAAPDLATIETASKIYGLLSAYKEPQVSLNSEGHPMFLFEGRHRGEVVVTSPNAIDYYFHDAGENALFEDDVPFSDHLPLEVLQYLRS